MDALVPTEAIEGKIYLIRGHKVMISTDIAKLYGVEVRVLTQAVKRNIERFPDDFMFQLNDNEFANLKSQFVISSWGGLRRANPYAFTEQLIEGDNYHALSVLNYTHEKKVKLSPIPEAILRVYRRIFK